MPEPEKQIIKLYETVLNQPFRPERRYQIDTIAKLERLYKRKIPRSYFVMAQGGGKTTTATLAMLRLSEQFYEEHHRFPKILWMVHKVPERYSSFLPEDIHGNHSEQREEHLEQRLQKMLTKNGLPLKITAKRHDTEYVGKYGGFLLNTAKEVYQERKKLPQTFFDFAVIDDCEYSETETYQRILRYFMPRMVLGITEPPFMKHEIDDAERYFINKAGYYGIFELAQQFHVFPDVLVHVPEFEYSCAVDRTLEFAHDWRQGRIANRNHIVADDIADIILGEPYTPYQATADTHPFNPQTFIDKPAVIFTETDEQSRHLQKLLHYENNISSSIISKKTTGQQRRTRIKEVESGSIDVLLSTEALHQEIDRENIQIVSFAKVLIENMRPFTHHIEHVMHNTDDGNISLVVDYTNNMQRFLEARSSASEEEYHEHLRSRKKTIRMLSGNALAQNVRKARTLQFRLTDLLGPESI